MKDFLGKGSVTDTMASQLYEYTNMPTERGI